MVICLVIAASSYIQTGNLKSFYYADLSFFHHPSYMAMYGTVSLVYLYLSILRPEKIKTYYFKSSLSKLALISVISLFIILLMSKAGILFALIINGIGILAVFKRKKKLKQAFMALAGLMLIVIGAYLSITPLEKRVNEVWVSLTSESPTESSTGARLLAWEASWEVIQSSPVIGAGTGDLSNELDNIYREKAHQKMLKLSLNAHNQFLETWGKNGFIGLLSLLLLFYYAFASKRNYFYLLFVLLIWSNMFLESMLQIQSGIVFIAFMNSMFVAAVIHKE